MIKINYKFNYFYKYFKNSNYLKYITLGFYCLLFSFLLLSSCNEGLVPVNDKSYLQGTIHYLGGKGSWPPADSVKDIRLVAFKDYPTADSIIFLEVLQMQAYFTSSLPFFVDSCTYSLEIPSPPIFLKYIALGQNYDSIITHWKVIGVYTTTGDVTNPSQIFINTSSTYTANINVDFSKLPPQPH